MLGQFYRTVAFFRGPCRHGSRGLMGRLAFTALGLLLAMLGPALALGCRNTSPRRRAHSTPRSYAGCPGGSGIRPDACAAAELGSDLTNLLIDFLFFEFISDQRHS
jgi:hypothetical protein